MIDYARGIDVNHYHRPKDWRAVFDAGISFVGIKATQGSGYVDPTFVDSRAAAVAGAELVILYHYADASDVDDQVEHFLETIGELAPNETVALDLERAAGAWPPFVTSTPFAQSDVFDRADEWIGLVGDCTDRLPLVYTRGLWNALGNPRLTWAHGLDLWVPRYRNLELGPGELPASWDTWRFWQWTDGTTPPHPEVPGAGVVDGDVFNGTRDDLRRYVTELVPPAPPEAA